MPHPIDPFLLDILPPGERAISHQLVVQADPRLADWQLLAFPTRGFGGVHRIQPGEAFDFSGKYGTRIYAAARAEPVPENLTDEWKAVHVGCDLPVSEVASVPFLCPLQHVLTTLKVEQLDARTLALGVAHEERDYAWPPLLGWLVPLALALAGGWGLLALRRRRARRGARA